MTTNCLLIFEIKFPETIMKTRMIIPCIEPIIPEIEPRIAKKIEITRNGTKPIIHRIILFFLLAYSESLNSVASFCPIKNPGMVRIGKFRLSLMRKI